jgi:adenylate cyclase, class 2
MSFEVELKYRTDDHVALAEKLAALGASASAPISQEDVYLSHPARDFAATNEALRLRRVGKSNRITYKGARRSGPTKTREEIEIPFAEGADSLKQMTRLFQNLGFGRIAVVRKSRRTFHLIHLGREIEVSLDLAEGLGAFVEVEAIAQGEDDLAPAQASVLDLAVELNLGEVEPRSYLRMLLERGPR